MDETYQGETEAELVAEAGNDPYKEIREHFEAGLALTAEETDAVADVAVECLKSILGYFGEYKCSIDEYDGDDGDLILDVNGGDLAVLIGRHGRTLEALQTVLSSLVSARLQFHYPIVVDIEGYKSRRRNKLTSLAISSAARAKSQGKVTLAPMNAYERRIVHLALVNDPDVTTHSEGEDPDRRVVITAVRHH